MANGFLCAIFPYLLGLTLLLFLLWALLHLTRPKKDPADPVPAPVEILWLTPACVKALGRCSQPLRLRSMSADGISARLDRYNFGEESPPTREQYSTWPEQADLICQGKFKELAERQKELREKYGVAGNQPGPANLAASRGAWTSLDALLVFVFICALLTALCWILTDFVRTCAPTPCEPCKTVCPKCEKPPAPPLKLSTDQLFEYAEAKVIDSQRLRSFLEDSLKQYKGAKLTITGHTDPIGGACYNEDLAKRRVDAIEAIVHQFVPADQVNQPAGKLFVTMDELPEPDRKIADTCLDTFHKNVPPNEKPLRYFDDKTDAKERKCAKDRNDWTPNYIWGRACRGEGDGDENKCLEKYKFENSTLIAMKRTAHFYKLQRCLAPLRRVEIKIDNSPRAAGEIGSGASR
jgi:hypothetical protein